jgi:hypothetical protein
LRTHHCFAALIEPATGQIHTDQTGKFVVASNSGNNYMIVLHDYDSNSILVEAIRSRTGPCILAGYQVLHSRLVAAGLRPKLQRLDNECSVALKQFLAAEDVDFQLVPPHLHRRNAAERAILTFKNHFIAGLCSVDKDFPLHLWDKLLPPAELTLNMLRGSRLNPKLSAHAQMHGLMDFNRTPLAPPGIRVLVHIKPSERTSWSPHGADGWYIGPALDSYRCYTVWMWDTRPCHTHLRHTGVVPNQSDHAAGVVQRPNPCGHPRYPSGTAASLARLLISAINRQSSRRLNHADDHPG